MSETVNEKRAEWNPRPETRRSTVDALLFALAHQAAEKNTDELTVLAHSVNVEWAIRQLKREVVWHVEND